MTAAMATIRRASRADAKACWDVRRAAVIDQCADAYTRAQLEEWTSGEASRAFADAVEDRFHIATIDARVVATGMINLATGKIDAIFVHPEFMRRELGTAMIAHLEALARATGLAQLTLESTLNAAPFYRSLGFEGDAISRFCSSRGLTMDCVPMVKRLAA
jgi:GNAT superfamily N-acetyltransferase